jgi:hypothetical protein
MSDAQRILAALAKENTRLSSRQDAVVMAVHGVVANYNTVYRELQGNWNSDQQVYSLQYISYDRMHRIDIKALPIAGTIYVHATLDESPNIQSVEIK